MVINLINHCCPRSSMRGEIKFGRKGLRVETHLPLAISWCNCLCNNF